MNDEQLSQSEDDSFALRSPQPLLPSTSTGSMNPMMNTLSINEESCSKGGSKLSTMFPVFEPPKETMEWFQKVISDGPDQNYAQKLKSSSWLNDSLREEVRPLQRHIGNDGTCDTAALAEAA
jgi:hypothetical protein